MFQQKNDDIARRILEIEQEVKALNNGETLAKVFEEQEELQRLLSQYCNLTMFMANIGVGKSTSANMLATFGRGKAIFEPIHNPVLGEYYQEWVKHNRGETSRIRQMAERLQIDVIGKRLHQIIVESGRHPNEPLISDRSPYEDLIFISALCDAGILSEDQRSYLVRYFGEQKASLEQEYNVNLTPKLLVFLKRKLETGWKRVDQRNRGMEVGGGLSKEFYSGLHNRYEELTDQTKLRNTFGYGGPIAVLGCDDVDITDLSNSRGILYLVKSVRGALEIAYES